MSDLPNVIDSHVHFINPERHDYPWMSDAPSLQRAFVPQDYQRASAAATVDHLVFVEVCPQIDQALAEAQWVDSLRQEDPRIAAIVARAALTDTAARQAQLEALASLDAVKGIRDIIQWEPLGYCNQTAYIEGVRLLPHYGLHCELCLFHPQLADALELVTACPDVRFVMNHCAKPGIKDRHWQPWAEQMQELGKQDNVVCKLSALLTEADLDNWQADEILPYLKHVVDCFGPQRLLFGGDWPVCTLAGTWADWYAITLRLTASWSDSERQAFFHDNAAATYGIDT